MMGMTDTDGKRREQENWITCLVSLFKLRQYLSRGLRVNIKMGHRYE